MKKITILVVALFMGIAAYAQTAVPVPTATIYKSVYSAALGNAEGFAFDSWGGGNGEVISIEGTEAYKISNFRYFGSGFVSIDATPYDFLALDIYPLQDMTLAIVPITGRPEKGMNTGNLTGGQWNHIELSVPTYTERGANMANVYQIKFVSKVVAEGGYDQYDGFENGDGTKSFIVGNIYFYKEKAQYQDDEAPVIVTAEVTNITSTSAEIKVKATDNLSPKVYFAAATNGKTYTLTADSGVDGTLKINGLDPGTDYTVSLTASDESDNVSQPTVLNFTTIDIPEIPEPKAGEKVTVFSPYLGNADGFFFDSWGGGTGADLTIHGKDAYQISNFQWFGSMFAAVDATPYERLHLDIYPMQDMTLAIVPITGRPEKGLNTGDLTGGQWNQIELSVPTYTARGANMANVYQIKFVSKVVNEGGYDAVDGFANGDGTESFIVGNIYFYTPDITGITDVTAVTVDPAQPMYNPLGQRVSEAYKGIVIQNGKKFIRF